MAETLPNPAFWLMPLFLVVLAFDMWRARRRGESRYQGRDSLVSLLLGAGGAIAGLAKAGVVVALALWFAEHRLFGFGLAWWAWPLCFLADDLAYYVFHRSAHRVRWFWANHVVHHSSERFNYTTALRHGWTSLIAFSFVFRLPLLLVFPPAMVAFCTGLNTVYQWWVHTEAVGRMPRWFEAVMNTPSHHRVHHATNPRYLDRNYAGTLIVWDRMFGSFEAERDEDRPRYGIVKPLGRPGLLTAAFHEWIAIARDVATRPGWRDKIGAVFAPPGWRADGSGETTDAIRARWLAEAGPGTPPVGEGAPPAARPLPAS